MVFTSLHPSHPQLIFKKDQLRLVRSAILSASLSRCFQGESITKLKERVKEKIDIQDKEFEKVSLSLKNVDNIKPGHGGLSSGTRTVLSRCLSVYRKGYNVKLLSFYQFFKEITKNEVLIALNCYTVCVLF